MSRPLESHPYRTSDDGGIGRIHGVDQGGWIYTNEPRFCASKETRRGGEWIESSGYKSLGGMGRYRDVCVIQVRVGAMFEKKILGCVAQVLRITGVGFTPVNK